MSELLPLHEHIIEISNPDRGQVSSISREGLWQGLVDFAKNPTQFIDALQSCRLAGQEQTAAGVVVTRCLNFGSFELHDQVTLIENRQIITDVEQTQAYPASRFIVTIEEPAEGALFLRFQYLEAFVTGISDNAQIQTLRRQAWSQKDRDVVDRILSSRAQ